MYLSGALLGVLVGRGKWKKRPQCCLLPGLSIKVVTFINIFIIIMIMMFIRDRLIHVFNAAKHYNFLNTLDDHSSSITAVRYILVTMMLVIVNFV